MKVLLLALLVSVSAATAQSLPSPQHESTAVCVKGVAMWASLGHLALDFCVNHINTNTPSECLKKQDELEKQKLLEKTISEFHVLRTKQVCK